MPAPTEFWKPFEFEVASFEALVDVIERIMEHAVQHDGRFAWRGQVDASWALHSSLYRRLNLTAKKIHKEKDLAAKESEILEELRRWGLHTHPTGGRLSILSQLALLQHYGAPTRLIDITMNAWVGVWFAVEQKWQNGEEVYGDKDARLFAVDITGRLINEHSDYSKWEDATTVPWPPTGNPPTSKEWGTSVYAWRPSRLDARISAQNGGFLFGGVPSTERPDGNRFQFPKSPKNADGCWLIDEGRGSCCLALRPHLFDAKQGNVGTGAMFSFRIKAAAKQKIRERLERLFGYTHATIYPDYTGFASFGTSALRSW
jgi:hypothetical protein